MSNKRKPRVQRVLEMAQKQKPATQSKFSKLSPYQQTDILNKLKNSD